MSMDVEDKQAFVRRIGKMIGEHERNNRCPLCGGCLARGTTAVPFLLPKTFVLVKNVPAEICASCHEPYTTGHVTDRIVSLLQPLRTLSAEVLILSFEESQPVASLADVAKAEPYAPVFSS